MFQSHYDDPVFFKKYGQMPRSREGLAGAGEWPALEAVLPDFSGKRLLDLGCGYGWHCAYALDHGAKRVVGVDLSRRMLGVAQQKIDDPRAQLICGAIETVDFPSDSFDVVLSSLALHYVADLQSVYENVYRMLTPGGIFVFNCEHPVFTAQGKQDFYHNERGEILHFPVDRYFEEGERRACFLGEEIVKYHRSLTTLLSGLLRCGFMLEQIVEPYPTQEMLDRIPEMRDELRRPMMLIVRAKKPL